MTGAHGFLWMLNIHDCFDPGSEFKQKYSIFEGINCQSTSTGAQFGVMVKLQKQSPRESSVTYCQVPETK